MKKQIIYVIIGIALAVFTQYKSNAQKDDPDIFFGFRDIKPNSKEQDYCPNLLDYLKQQHKDFHFKEIKIEYQQRFYQEEQILKSGKPIKLAVECGPNTITEKREEYLGSLKIRKTLKIKVDSKDCIKEPENCIDYPGKFSRPFLRTGTKLLLKRGDNNKNFDLYLKGILFSKTLPETRVVIVGSDSDRFPNSNLGLLRSKYPSAGMKTITSSSEIFSQFKSDKNIAYIGDEIRILDIVEEQKKLDPNFDKKYVVVPKYGTLSEQEYGIVLYKESFADPDQKIYNSISETINNWAIDEFKKNENQKNPNPFRAPRKWIETQFEVWYKGGLTSLWVLLVLASLTIIMFFFIFWLYQYQNLYLKPKKLLNKRIINNVVNEPELNIEELSKALSTLNESELLNIWPVEDYIKEAKKTLYIVNLKKILGELNPEVEKQEQMVNKILQSLKSNEPMKEELIRIVQEGGLDALEKALDNIPFFSISFALVKPAIETVIKKIIN